MATYSGDYVDSVGSSSQNPPTMLKQGHSFNLRVIATHVETYDPLDSSAVRLVSDVDCFVVFGAAPVASATNGMRIRAKIPEYFACKSSDKLSVIRSSASGMLNVMTAAMRTRAATGNAAIARTYTQLGRGDVKGVTAKTHQSAGRISIGRIKTLDAVSRVQSEALQTLAGTAAITI